MRVFCADTGILFTFHHPVMKVCIVFVGSPRETFGIIDLDVVPSGVCGVTFIFDQER